MNRSTGTVIRLEAELRVGDEGERLEHPALGEDVFKVLTCYLSTVCQDDTHIHMYDADEVGEILFSVLAKSMSESRDSARSPEDDVRVEKLSRGSRPRFTD